MVLTGKVKTPSLLPWSSSLCSGTGPTQSIAFHHWKYVVPLNLIRKLAAQCLSYNFYNQEVWPEFGENCKWSKSTEQVSGYCGDAEGICVSLYRQTEPPVTCKMYFIFNGTWYLYILIRYSMLLQCICIQNVMQTVILKTWISPCFRSGPPLKAGKTRTFYGLHQVWDKDDVGMGTLRGVLLCVGYHGYLVVLRLWVYSSIKLYKIEKSSYD